MPVGLTKGIKLNLSAAHELGRFDSHGGAMSGPIPLGPSAEMGDEFHTTLQDLEEARFPCYWMIWFIIGNVIYHLPHKKSHSFAIVALARCWGRFGSVSIVSKRTLVCAKTILTITMNLEKRSLILWWAHSIFLWVALRSKSKFLDNSSFLLL